MSDSYSCKNVGNDPWTKLLIYLRFRIISEGLWIEKSANFWFDAIMDEDTIITENKYYDSGGGPLDHHIIRVYKSYNPKKTLFETDFTYEDASEMGQVFVKRAEEVYRYVKSYGDGNGWYDAAIKLCEQYSDDHSIDAKKWHKVFELSEGVGMVDFELFNEISIDPLFPEIFGLLATLHDKAYLIESISFNDEVSKNICRVKEWAMYALLEMERYYCTAC